MRFVHEETRNIVIFLEFVPKPRRPELVLYPTDAQLAIKPPLGTSPPTGQLRSEHLAIQPRYDLIGRPSRGQPHRDIPAVVPVFSQTSDSPAGPQTVLTP